MEDGDLAALSGLDSERDRLPEVVEAAPVAEAAAGETAVAQCAGGTGQAELLGEGERPLGVTDARLVPSLQRPSGGDLGERSNEFRARFQWFE